MAETNIKKNQGPLINPALCRCCRSIKKCRLLTNEYEFMDTKEVYSDMLMDVFGLLVGENLFTFVFKSRLVIVIFFRYLIIEYKYVSYILSSGG